MLQNVRLFDSRSQGNAGNSPLETGQLQPYLSDATRRYIEKMSRYATDFFAAEVQGLNPDDPSKWEWYEIRAADAFSMLNTGAHSKGDDWRIVLFQCPDIQYIPSGTKFKFWNNVWLADNSSNTADFLGTTLVKRCYTCWNSLDYYGNIVSEPFVISDQATRSNANTDNEFIRLTGFYLDCMIQANPWTLSHLRENTRIALGSAVYAVRGISDYVREFTDDENSVGLLYFSLFYQEPTVDDDMENHVAGGKTFQWTITVNAPHTLLLGQTVTLQPVFLVQNKLPEKPVSYLWQSLTPDIVAVNEAGILQGLSEGKGTIRCILAQNPNIFTDIPVTVSAGDALDWACEVPDCIPAFTSTMLSVTKPVEWEILGGIDKSFSYQQTEKELTIHCYYPCDTPLTVRAKAASGQELTVRIALTAR